jgi:hypothetical protein
MNATAASKVTDSHLARSAYLYVRQSSLRQVVHNTESGQRQYALRQRAVAGGGAAPPNRERSRSAGQPSRSS